MEGDAQIMAAFNAVQAASFARRNQPTTPQPKPKPPKEPSPPPAGGAGMHSPETRVLLEVRRTAFSLGVWVAFFQACQQ